MTGLSTAIQETVYDNSLEVLLQLAGECGDAWFYQ